MVDVTGRLVVITGASRGLGAGLAQAVARRGGRLGLCARHEPPVPEGAEAVARAVDVADGAAVAAFAEEVADALGPIDLWVNNAGILEPIGPVRDLDPAAFARNLEVNVLGVLHGTQAFVRHVRARGGEGVLVNVSSGAAQRGYPGWAAYCGAKAAVDRLTEVVAAEEAAHGVRALAVGPGIVETDMQALIRSMPEERFPAVERFRTIHERGLANSAEHVARHLLAWAFDPSARPDDVVVRVPDEHAG